MYVLVGYFVLVEFTRRVLLVRSLFSTIFSRFQKVSYCSVQTTLRYSNVGAVKHSSYNIAKIFRKSTSNGLLICTLISENQGLEKSRSASNLRKFSGPANLDFFLGLHLEKSQVHFQVLFYKPEKNSGDETEKKIQVCRT